MIFGKKEEKPKKSIRISILTNDYLIEGFDDPEYHAFSAAYDTEADNLFNSSARLKDARIQPMGNLNTPVRTFEDWRVPSLFNVIAIFSDDPAADEILQEMWESYQTRFKVILYIGIYTIEGTIYSDDDTPPNFGMQMFAPMKDIKITNQADKKAEVIHGKWGVINSASMNGYSVEK